MKKSWEKKQQQKTKKRKEATRSPKVALLKNSTNTRGKKSWEKQQQKTKQRRRQERKLPGFPQCSGSFKKDLQTVEREKSWEKKTKKESSLSSVTLNCQATKIVMNLGSQLSEM